MEELAVSVEHAVVRFNMATERIDNLKEYLVKLVKRELMFKEFLALKDVNFKVSPGELLVRMDPENLLYLN